MTRNEQVLRILSIFHYVVAAFAGCISFFPSLHLAMGIAIASGALKDDKDPFPIEWVGWFFIFFASVWILCGLAFTVCMVVAGRSLQSRRRYVFCLVMAGMECLLMPFGTVLGVFTLITLTKDDIRALFPEVAAGEDAPGGPGARP